MYFPEELASQRQVVEPPERTESGVVPDSGHPVGDGGRGESLTLPQVHLADKSTWGRVDVAKLIAGLSRVEVDDEGESSVAEGRQSTHKKVILVVWNLAETLFGLVGPDAVFGAKFYGMRHIALYANDADTTVYFLVPEECFEGAQASLDLLREQGVYSDDTAPTLVSLRLDGATHSTALLKLLTSQEDDVRDQREAFTTAVPLGDVSSVQYFTYSPQAAALNDHLQSKWVGPSVALYRHDPDAVALAGNKTVMMEALAQRDPSFVLPHRVARSREEALRQYDEFANSEGGHNHVRLKAGAAVSGEMNKGAENREEVVAVLDAWDEDARKYTGQGIDDYLSQHGMLIETHMQEGFFSTGITFMLEDDGTVTPLSVSDQLTDKDGVHLANGFPSQIYDKEYRHLVPKMWDIIEAYAQELYERGFRGVAGMDVMVGKPVGKDVDDIFASDNNVRATGSSHLMSTFRRMLNPEAPYDDAELFGSREDVFDGGEYAGFTHNNIMVPAGMTPRQFQEIMNENGMGLAAFRDGDSNVAVQLVNGSIAQHAPLDAADGEGHKKQGKVQVAIVLRRESGENSATSRERCMEIIARLDRLFPKERYLAA